MKKTHTLRLAYLQPEVQYTEVDFGRRIECSEEEKMALADPIGFRIFGGELPFGPLFAYLFRRFGYPNAGWDPYKELVKYYLTTPDKDMVLKVTPHVSGSLRLSYGFYLPDARYQALERYDSKGMDDWRTRSLDWAEQRGLPDWMPEWVTLVNDQLLAIHGWATPVSDWRESLRFALTLGREGDPLHASTARASAFAREIWQSYQDVEPWPGYLSRTPNIEEWPDDDPLKPLAVAAQKALSNLLRCVRVRDSAITALGEDESWARPLTEPAVAGYPSGMLGNVAPVEVSEIHQLAVRLGRGNLRVGLRKVLAKFAEPDATPSAPAA